MGFRKTIICLLSAYMAILGVSTVAASPRLHVRQALSWNRNLTSEIDWSGDLSIEYQNSNFYILGGIRQQAPSTDIGLTTRFGLGSPAWSRPPFVEEIDGSNNKRRASFPAIMTVQSHVNVHQGGGTSVDLAVSAGQDFQTKDPDNWWGFSYSLGIHSSLSFSPYLEKPLINFNPTVLLNVSKAFAGRVFLGAYCDTNTLFLYTSQLSFIMGGSVSCRIADQFLIGASAAVRFADLPTETSFITLGEVSLFFNWLGALS